MPIYLPCTCEAEEHEITIEVDELSFSGLGEGDELPCGRIVTEADIEIINDRINAYYDSDYDEE